MIIIFPPMYSWDATAPSGSGPWYDSSFAIAVNGLYIRNGETTAVPFEAVEIGASGVLTYSLVNNSDETVVLTGDPYVAVSGEDFFISSQPSGDTLLADESLDFDITFAPTESGVRNAYISVANDTEDDPYVVNIYGVGAGRGIFGGGLVAGSPVQEIDYITIEPLSNVADFGDIYTSTYELSAVSSQTRAVFAGGINSLDTIGYVTMSTLGNTQEFGDLTAGRHSLAGCSNSTRGVFGGGFSPSGITNTIDYITIASVGNATDFGDFSTPITGVAACSSSTRGVFGGGIGSNIINYLTISTTGTVDIFGELTIGRSMIGSCSGSTIGVFAGGFSTTNIIDYITISTLANAVDFGDLTVPGFRIAACSSLTRGVFAGGTSRGNTIDYILFASSSNAEDFGDLTAAKGGAAGCSNAHGGLG